MALKYDLYKTNDVQDEEDKGLLRARAVSQGTITTQKLTDWIEQTSGFKSGDVKGMLAVLTDAVLKFLEEGYVVQLDELGYFSVSLTSRPVKSAKDIRAESVVFNRLNFRAGKKARYYLKYAEVERVIRPRGDASDLSLEGRRTILKKHLEEHPFVTRAEYCRITSTLKNKAINDLNNFTNEGWLKRHGVGKTVIYMLNKTP